MKAFMAISQAVRDVLLFFVCAAILILGIISTWLVDAETLRQCKENHND